MIWLPGETRPRNVHGHHAYYSEILMAAQAGDWDRVRELLSPHRSLSLRCSDRVVIDKGNFFVDGNPVDVRLTRTIRDGLIRGKNMDKYIRLLENIWLNPDTRVVGELFDFLDGNNLPITDDGCILAWKVTRKDGYSIAVDQRAGEPVYYGLGAKPEMPRDAVDDDPNNTCSTGLH